MIARFLGAIQFLTLIPVPRATATAAASAMFFPLVGAMIGCASGFLLFGLREIVPAPMAALGVLIFGALLTGGLHEDGLADVADAFRASRSPERILAILKDSRIGAHGALALVLATLIRFQGLSDLVVPPVGGLAATFACSRAAVVALAWISPPSGTGLGWQFSQQLTTSAAILALAPGIAIAYFAPAGPILVWGTCLIIGVARAYFVRRIGGVTGDCLGATAIVVETWGLVLYSCRRCI